MDNPPPEPPTTSSYPPVLVLQRRKGKAPDLFSNLEARGGAEEGAVAARGPAKISLPVSSGILQQFILEALAFTFMEDRQEEVAEAHGKTFEWIFDGAAGERTKTPGSNFAHWLRDTGDDVGIYWINGKAGSDKSTLLRFVYEHDMTRQELRRWAEPKSLTMAGFFFWTSGSLEQRSQAGLLRSLLHQLLEDHRDLISETFPDMWGKYSDMSTKERISTPISWSLSDLMDGFKLFLGKAAGQSRICLFIDGLDEFAGDHGEIIGLFKNIVEPESRMSKPWPVFENAFESVPHLKLQDLTLEDRKRYVVDSMNKDALMRHIIHKEPERSAKMMAEIVERADGVFLWVILVVRSLLGDLSTGDTVKNITDRLNLLPTNLEAFFRHTLFDRQDKAAKKEASRILQLIRARETASSLTLWELTLAHLIAEDNNQAVNTSVCQATDEQVLGPCNAMKGILQAHCAGLLGNHPKRVKGSRSAARFAGKTQLYSVAEGKVTYLHRTVRDWLIFSPSVWRTVLGFTALPEYNPHANLLASHILYLKFPLDEPEHHRRLDDWWPGIVLSMSHARYSHVFGNGQNASRVSELLDELEKTLSWFWLTRPSQQGDHWARNTFGSYEERNKNIISYPFLALATKFGLREYVMSKIQWSKHVGENLGYVGGKPLLIYATEFLISRKKTVFPLADSMFITQLLSSGQDPNLEYTDFSGKGETPWLSCVKLVREALRRRWIALHDPNVGKWTSILRSFVHYGANVNAIIVATRWDPEITVLEVVDHVYAEFELEVVRELKEAMLAKAQGREVCSCARSLESMQRIY